MESSKQDRIKELIKALLRKQNGGTPQEIETALAKAQELALKYHIDLASVNPDEDLYKLEEACINIYTQWPLQARLAGALVMRYFNVDVYLKHDRRFGHHEMTFVGDRLDIAIAEYVYDFLEGRMRSLWLSYKRMMPGADRGSFMHGVWQGVAERLEAEKQAQEADSANKLGLVLIGNKLAKRKAYMAEHHGDLKSKKTRLQNYNAMDYAMGKEEGSKLRIRQGIDAVQNQPAGHIS